jgi:hypothetical protein
MESLFEKRKLFGSCRNWFILSGIPAYQLDLK